jgi:hypothetical protein
MDRRVDEFDLMNEYETWEDCRTTSFYDMSYMVIITDNNNLFQCEYYRHLLDGVEDCLGGEDEELDDTCLLRASPRKPRPILLNQRSQTFACAVKQLLTR